MGILSWLSSSFLSASLSASKGLKWEMEERRGWEGEVVVEGKVWGGEEPLGECLKGAIPTTISPSSILLPTTGGGGASLAALAEAAEAAAAVAAAVAEFVEEEEVVVEVGGVGALSKGGSSA